MLLCRACTEESRPVDYPEEHQRNSHPCFPRPTPLFKYEVTQAREIKIEGSYTEIPKADAENLGDEGPDQDEGSTVRTLGPRDNLFCFQKKRHLGP